MIKPFLFRHTVQCLDTVLNSNFPADKNIEQYFRKNRNLGSHDRRFLAESVYGCLRQRRLLETIVDMMPSPAESILAVYLLRNAGWSAARLQEAGYSATHPALEVNRLTTRTRTLEINQLPFAVQFNLPDWLSEKLLAYYGEEETRQLAQSLNQPATLDLRINTLKTDRTTAKQKLQDEGFATELMPYSPLGLRRAERAPIFNTECFKQGLIEVQDEGSQLLSLLVQAQARETVIDFCAGAGGKTLALGAQMQNRGQLYAFDIYSKRLDNLRQRLKRASLDNVRPVLIKHEQDDRVRRLAGKADRVLVDAPCSGTGTLRRNPDIKWRPINLDELFKTQQSILQAAATLVKPGGRLVYATCSLLQEENDAVVQDFLAKHPQFFSLSAQQLLQEQDILLQLDDNALRLLPHKHNTDGFYGMVMQRKESDSPI